MLNNTNKDSKVEFNSQLSANGSGKKSNNYTEEDEVNKPGFFRKAIPIMPKPLAIICCLFNIIVPGFGTNFLKLFFFLIFNKF